jgi:hypothetical protein
VLAAELGLDLYRIDLAATVSKYIGETEKNLSRLFDAAEASGAVLLFDEADALFGKRGEVKDGHDRYANLEVAYLLQRMESYRGLAILTTNLRSNVDRAFLRRLRFVVQFPFPDAEQRAEIWRRTIPADAPLDGVEPEQVARLNVSGGSIRSIALSAAFAAAEDGTPITRAHVLRARAGRLREGRARAHGLRERRPAMTRLEIVIDELVVRGLPPEQARARGRALEARLTALAEAARGRRASRARRVVPAARALWMPRRLARRSRRRRRGRRVGRARNGGGRR